MSNVLIALVVMVIGFVLASYGVYDNVQASRRSSLATTISSKMNRLAVYNQDLREDIGHQPLHPNQEVSTGFASYNQDMLDREAFGSVTFRFHANASGYHVCATSNDTGQTMQEAMQMIAKNHPPAYVSGSCGESNVAVGSNVVTSLRIGS